MSARGAGDQRPVIIVRRKKVVHGHHGGSWKIALADFMTALMALFLVMWIISNAGQKEREAVAEYFRTPLLVSLTGGERQGTSANVIPGGGPDPAHAEGERQRIDPLSQTRPTEIQRRALQNLQQRIINAVEASPQLRELRIQMRFDVTREGLRVQLVDTDARPMFDLASDRVAPYMRDLLHLLAPLLNGLPNDLSIGGHTDGLQYVDGVRGVGNWELSAGRANATRRELVAGGLDADKLLRVSGFADRVPLPSTTAVDPANRRIEVVVLFDEVAERIRRPVDAVDGFGRPLEAPAAAAGAEAGVQGAPEGAGGGVPGVPAD